MPNEIIIPLYIFISSIICILCIFSILLIFNLKIQKENDKLREENMYLEAKVQTYKYLNT